MRVELINAEVEILREIADSRFKREDVALTYAYVIRQLPAGDPQWRTINEAIVERWSLSALKWIKERAWKLLSESNAVSEPHE